MVYSVGVFYAWDFIAIILITILYYYCPKNIIDKKNEYIQFFLYFLSILFTIFIFIINITRSTAFTHMLFKISFIPLLFIFYSLYKFKNNKKNQNLYFFLLVISIYIVLVFSAMYIGILLSTM